MSSLIPTADELVRAAIAPMPRTDGEISRITGLSRAKVKRTLDAMCSRGEARIVDHVQIINLRKPLWGTQ